MNTHIKSEEAMSLVLDEHGTAVKDANVEATIKAMEPTLEHGAEWPAHFFELHLGKLNNTAAFGKGMHKIQLRLESQGYHLTSRGKNATSWWVEKVKNTGRVVSGMHRKAMGLLRRSAVLAHSTSTLHADKLDENERRRLEHRGRVQAIRFLTASRIR